MPHPVYFIYTRKIRVTKTENVENALLCTALNQMEEVINWIISTFLWISYNQRWQVTTGYFISLHTPPHPHHLFKQLEWEKRVAMVTTFLSLTFININRYTKESVCYNPFFKNGRLGDSVKVAVKMAVFINGCVHVR